MLVLCYGMPKSGSTLAFELVKAMLSDAGYEQETFINDRPSGLQPRSNARGARNYLEYPTKEKIAAAIDHIGRGRKIAVKTHGTFPPALFSWFENLQSSGDLQVVAAYRDPREVCLSLLDAGERARAIGKVSFGGIDEMERACQNILTRLEGFRRWAALKGTLRLFYDQFAFSPDGAMDRIEAALGIRCNRKAVREYVYFKAPTQRNKVKPQRYRDELSEQQNARMLETFGEFIERVCMRDDQSWFDECRSRLRDSAAAHN